MSLSYSWKSRIRFTHSFHAFVSRIRFTHSFHAFVSRIRFTHSFHAFVSRIRFTHSFHAFVSRIRFTHSFHAFVSRIRFTHSFHASVLFISLSGFIGVRYPRLLLKDACRNLYQEILSPLSTSTNAKFTVLKSLQNHLIEEELRLHQAEKGPGMYSLHRNYVDNKSVCTCMCTFTCTCALLLSIFI